MASKKKNGSSAPLIIVIILFVVLAAALVLLIAKEGLSLGPIQIAPWSSEKSEYERRREELPAQVDAENAALITAYNDEVSEIVAYNNSLLEEHRPEASAHGWDLVDVSDFSVQNMAAVSVTREDLLLGGGILVNYWHSVPGDMPEDQLVSVQTALNRKWQVGREGASIRVYPVVLNALDAMLTDAKAAGYEDYIVDQAWRSNDTQTELWQKEESKSKYANLMGESLRDRVNEVVSYPGTSEYQTGFAICLLRYKKGEAEFNRTFAGTEHSAWMLANSWKYGFIFRFPISGYPADDTVDKSWITGRNSQMSVYRYVGRANAAIMYTQDWCMEEYYQYLAEHPHLELYEDGVLKYEVVRYPYDGSYAVEALFNSSCECEPEVTMDNLGGIIVGMCY